MALAPEPVGSLTLNPRTAPRGAYAGIAYAGQAYASQAIGQDVVIAPEPVGSL